jgi:hypothetical protein
MYAGSHRRGFAFFLDVVAAIPNEGPSMAIGHHVGSQVAAIGAAKCEGAAVAIEGPGFAGNVAVTDEGAQMFGGGPSRWPVVGTRLVRLGRVDSPQAIGHTIDPERIAINYPDGLGKGWYGRKREGSGQNGQFHRIRLARDWGKNAAAYFNRCRPPAVRFNECKPPEILSQPSSTA